jgi:uncharacterized membrane protein (UPF0127 family)
VTGWLLHGATVLASAEVVESRAARVRGLLGRDGIDGVLVLRPCRSIHTLGMRFTIDVVWCDGDLHVLRVATVRPWRLTRPVPGTRVVIEGEAGTFSGSEVRVGDQLILREGADP